LARLPRVAAASALLLLVAVVPAAPFDVRETPEGVAIVKPRLRGPLRPAGRGAGRHPRRQDGPRGLGGERSGRGLPKGPGTQTIGALLKTASEGKGADETVVLDYATSAKDSVARIEVRPFDDALRLTVRLLVSEADMVPGFAWKLAPSGFWYGGGFQASATPGLAAQRRVDGPPDLPRERPLAGDAVLVHDGGVGLRVRTPLDFRYSVNEVVDGRRTACSASPCPSPPRSSTTSWWRRTSARSCGASPARPATPRRVPPAEYFRLPIYTTWVEHKAAVDQAKVLEFARAIRAHDLPAGVLELDDKWEVHYGDMDFDPVKFPDPKAMNDELHRMGFRSTLWVHPFVNPDTATFARTGTTAYSCATRRAAPG